MGLNGRGIGLLVGAILSLILGEKLDAVGGVSAVGQSIDSFVAFVLTVLACFSQTKKAPSA
jgi:hypothetical protein